MRVLVDAARPSIVTVIARRSSRPQAGKAHVPSVRGRVSVGSGVVYDDGGLVVTTASVADEDDEILVQTASGQSFPARLLVRDPTANVALLDIGTRALRSIPLARSSALAPGAWVVLVGYADGSREASSALGTVSEPFPVSGLREGGRVLTVNAPVRPGWSGGAVLNPAGELIGLVAGRLDGPDPSTLQAARRPFAGPVPEEVESREGATVVIPVEQLQDVAAEVLTPDREERGFLGVRVVGLTPHLRNRLGAGEETRGVVVFEILPGAPAERAGLRSGDVIVGLGSNPVRDVADLTRRVAVMSPGARARLDYVRDGERRRISVEIGELPPALREEQALSDETSRQRDRRKFLHEEIRRLEEELERFRRELSALER
jgi:serine protease Do